HSALHSFPTRRSSDLGSADDTSQMVGTLRDHRVRLLRHDTALGVSATRNHGAAEARGEWLGFIDDDDVWAPDKLAREIQAARTTDRKSTRLNSSHDQI